MRPTGAGTLMVERARRALNEPERARVGIRPTPGAVNGIETWPCGPTPCAYRSGWS